MPKDRDMIFGWIRQDLGPNGLLELDKVVIAAAGTGVWAFKGIMFFRQSRAQCCLLPQMKQVRNQ